MHMRAKRKSRQATQRYHLLRGEVQGMPLGLAGAMLSSLDEMDIVAGQYTDSQGGSCPLLAAWQSSKYTVTLKHTFPGTWDVFCGITHSRQARPATKHEINMLRMLLQERIMPLGERPLLDQTPEITAAPQTIVVPEPASVEVLSASETPDWSCDWEAELQQLHSRSGFIRHRRVAEQPVMDVYSDAWVSHIGQLMHGIKPTEVTRQTISI